MKFLKIKKNATNMKNVLIGKNIWIRYTHWQFTVKDVEFIDEEFIVSALDNDINGRIHNFVFSSQQMENIIAQGGVFASK